MQPLNTMVRPKGRIDHGLLGGIGQIDDLQAAMAERHAALGESAGAVGTAGSQHLGHGLDRTAAGGISIEPDFTADATHGFSDLLGRRVHGR